VNRDFIERELRFAMFIENVLAIIINTSLFLILKMSQKFEYRN